MCDDACKIYIFRIYLFSLLILLFYYPFQDIQISCQSKFNFIIIRMYRFFRGVKKLIFSFSYFQASQYFRFRKSDAYVHSSAALLSFILQVIITISLVYQLVYIFQMKSAAVTTVTSYNYPPSLTNIWQANHNNNFMVAIEKVSVVDGLTIQFIQNTQTTSSKTPTVLGNAEPCTLQHWSGVSLSAEDFSNNNMGNWLCMPKGIVAVLEGAKNSKKYSYMTIDIKCPSCTASTIQLLLHYKDTLLNPSNGTGYLTYYINHDNAISITNSLSYNSISFAMEDFTVESDTTVMPWYTFIYEKGLISAGSTSQTVVSSTTSYRSQINFRKSAKSTVYTRNILKILDAFYFIIGSFAPTLLAFAFFIYPILSSIFQMRFAKYVYRLQQGKTYGLLDFFKENFYTLFKSICSLDSQKWSRQEKITQVRQILSKIMQIQYLYQRIDFLERSIKFLFKDHHLCGLRLMRKDSIIDADEKYKNYQIRKAIKNYVISGQRKQIQQLKVTSKNIIPRTQKTQKQLREQVQLPANRMLSQKIDLKKLSINIPSKNNIKKFQATKQFEINKLDYEGEKMCNRIEENKQFYMKLVSDFKKLKKQAQSYDSNDYIGKMIYDELKQNDVDLMQAFEKRMRNSDKQGKQVKQQQKAQIMNVKKDVKKEMKIKQIKQVSEIEDDSPSPMRSQSMLFSAKFIQNQFPRPKDK